MAMDDIVQCAHCGKEINIDNSVFVEGERLCPSCDEKESEKRNPHFRSTTTGTCPRG